MGIPFLRGRAPERDEPSLAVVNQALADRQPQDELLGRQVVGVVPNSPQWSLTESPRPFLYQIATQFDEPIAALAIRTKGPAADFASQVSETIQRLNPDLPPIAAQTGAQRLRLWLEPQRAAALLLGTLSLAALALAITGLYALLAQVLVQRTPEIAVRVALGASRRRVLALLLRQSAIPVAAGTAAGMAASAALARLVGELDAPTLLAIVALIATVSAAATAIPAYRALRIDPASALRSE
jgi:ABC-type antimicrobial peptide transport system permease subunit